MSPQTMTERTKYLETFEQEHQTTLRLLRHYPADKLDIKPGAKGNTARDVIWSLALGEMAIGMLAEKDELTPEGMPKAPATMPELMTGLERVHRETAAKLHQLDDARFHANVRVPVGPKKMGDVRRGDALWMFLYDAIHHRGQLTVYHRMVGAKVPSVYGPTADEPWF